MRTIVILAATVLVALFLLVQMAIAPVALKQDGKPSAVDLSHPPTPYGASTVVSAPAERRH